MCIKLQKPLNPQAQEYRRRQYPPPPPPMPPLLPHIIFRPHPLPLSAPSPPQLVAPPQLKLQPYVFHPRPRYTIHTHYTHCPHPLHATVPAHLYLPKAAADAAPPPLHTGAASPSSPPSDTKQRSVKSPKCPRRDVSRKRSKNIPPRIRKALVERAHAPPPPPPLPVKQEWRPKVAANIAAPSSPPPPTPSMTTLMIKNIPNHLRREFMLKFLDDFCKTHSLAYDFFYLPIDFSSCRNGNFGYAFVNFTTNDAAVKMMKILNNYKWAGKFHSKKVLEMSWARVQGKEALIRRFKSSKFKCSEAEFLPVVLDPPRDGSDPNPPAPVILGKLSI